MQLRSVYHNNGYIRCDTRIVPHRSHGTRNFKDVLGLRAIENYRFGPTNKDIFHCHVSNPLKELTYVFNECCLA